MMICLIRHGQTNANQARIFQGRVDNSLNEKGKQQIKASALDLLNNNNWDIIISSPLKRALQSAEIIKEQLKLTSEIIIDQLLIERSFGAAEGLPLSEENYHLIHLGAFKDLETEAMLEARAQQLLLSLKRNYPHKNLILVTHAQLIKAILKQYHPEVAYQTRIMNAEAIILTI